MAIPCRFLLLVPVFIFSAIKLSVASHPSKLVLPSGQLVESYPGAHDIELCFRTRNIELCFHRNASIGVGMCPPSHWQKLSKGSWAQSMSPYAKIILDIRAPANQSEPIEVSTEEEFLLHPVGFLVLGAVLMVMARFLSQWLVFYYGSAMAVGIVLVILMVFVQGTRLLPIGRKSSLAIFIYSSIVSIDLVGVATFLLHYVSGLLRSILVKIGISEDMHNPISLDSI